MVIVRIWEGLGNQMFQYAFARALKEKGVDVRIDLKKAYDEIFEKNKKHDFRCNSIQNYQITLPEIDVEDYGKYNYLRKKTIEDKIFYWMGTHSMLKYKFYEEKMNKKLGNSIQRKGDCYIKGWFQNEQYFKEIRKILLKEFIPYQKIKISKEIGDILKDKESVSIHIRRKDYVKMQNELNMSYYNRAIAFINKIYINPVFLIFSDDLKWVKDNFKINNNFFLIDENITDYEALIIMSKCRSNIIANSTFSWWGAWLNKNERKYVIAPKQWFPTQRNIVLNDWTII